MKKKNHIKMRFSTLLLCCLTIVLCAAPRSRAFSMYCGYSNVDYYDVTEDMVNEARAEQGLDEGGLDYLEVGTGATVNLYTDVSQSIYVYPGGILNIYSGSVVWYIAISQDGPKAQVTVYGTGFEDKLGPVDYGQWTPDGGADTLMGQYEDGSQINLLIWSNISISLQPPPSGDLEKITIDIKPGSDHNSINLKSWGVVPVAVLTTSDFNADTIDPTTVKFAGA